MEPARSPDGAAAQRHKHFELQSLRRQLGPEVADGALHRGSLQLHGPTQLPQIRRRL